MSMDKPIVMIADGRSFFRAGVRDAMDHDGGAEGLEIIEFDTEAGGDEAMARMGAESPDIVLLDIGYPMMSGLEMCRRIVRTLPLAKVVMLSSNPEEDDNELFDAIRTGAAAYLRSNECSSTALSETIQRICRGEYPINDSVGSRPEIAHRVLRRFQDMASGVREEDDIASPLTERELRILNLVAEGNGNKQIATILGAGEQGIKNNVSSILRKLSANDRAHAVMLAVRGGWVRTARDRSLGRRSGDQLAEAPSPLRPYSN